MSITVTERAARSDRALATWGLMIATAMQAADALIVNVALPKLEYDLGGGVELGAWVIAGYLCATAVAAPLTGWLRRRYGARRLWSTTIGAFLAASLLCALAPAAAALILFRVLQGAAGGVILPLGQAILLDSYPKERHGQMLAIWAAVTMAGPILGPLAGGIITDLSSWRWVFVINLPLGLFAIWSMRRLSTATDLQENPPIDVIGFMLLMIAVGGLQLCLERGIGRSWLASPELIIEASVTAIAFSAMMARAWYSGFTVFRLTVFKDVNFALGAFYNFMTSGLLFVTVVFLPALAEGPFALLATVAGFSIVPRALLMTVVMLAVGQLIGRIDYRVLLVGGWTLMAAGLEILARISPDHALAWIIVGSSVQAVGAGLLFTPHSTLAYSTLRPDLRTDASGLYSLLRQLGFASGVALMTAVLRAKTGENLVGMAAAGAGRVGLVTAQLAAYRDCFHLMAITSLIVAPGLFLFRLTASTSPKDAEPS
jgi:DHA2 family multidrug resistance protein